MAPKNKKAAAAKAEAKPKVEEPKVEEAKVEEPKKEEPAAAAPKAKAEPKAEGKKKAAAKAEPKAKEAPKEAVPKEAAPKEEVVKEAPKLDDKGMRINVDRADVEKFLSEGVNKMKSKATKTALADKSAGRPGGLLIELQQKVWDDMGVSRNHGRQAVDELEKRFEEDNEKLVEARDLFIRTAQLTYLQSLEDRKPDPLETEAELTREAVLEFCDACCAKADLKETKDAMGAKLTEGEMPDQVILDIQMDMFETLGYEREHGKDSLEKLETLYPKDQELMRSTSIWQNKGQTTCLIVLDKHMLEGGELPENVQKEALELQVLQHRAKDQLSKMTAQARGEIFEKLRSKVQVFRSLPPDIRQRHMQKLPMDEKVELIKGDVLFATVAQQQQQQKQREQQRQQYEAHMKKQMELKAVADAKQKAFEERKEKAHKKANSKKHAC